MVVVVVDVGQGLVLVEPGPADRLFCALRSDTLDRELAAGLRPEASRRRSLWAALLVTPARRRCFAATLRRLVAAADDPLGRGARRLPPPTRARLRACAEDLGRLSARLTAPQPVTAAGMARVRLLLTDGGGPLHGPAPAAVLRRAVAEALAALDEPLSW
jgi:hypothetical protein